MEIHIFNKFVHYPLSSLPITLFLLSAKYGNDIGKIRGNALLYICYIHVWHFPCLTQNSRYLHRVKGGINMENSDSQQFSHISCVIVYSVGGSTLSNDINKQRSHQ